MEKHVKSAKTEKILLAVTTLFLCVLLGLYWRDRQAALTPGVVTETELEVPQEDFIPEPPEVPAMTKVHLNTATEAELTTLPGIGETLARRIVEYREAHGPFETAEEMMEVSGIGEKKFAELRDLVIVD